MLKTNVQHTTKGAPFDAPLSFSCGAGGSRTLVQTRRKYAFYKFSHRLVVGGGMVRDGPKRRLSSKVSPQPRSAALAISPFMILRSGR